MNDYIPAEPAEVVELRARVTVLEAEAVALRLDNARLTAMVNLHDALNQYRHTA